MQWALSFPSKSTSRFAYIKGGKIIINTNETPYPPILIPSFRGLETRCIQLIGRLLISGGEDGTLRVHDSDGSAFKLLSCRREHESVILGCTPVLNGIIFTCGAKDSVVAWKGTDDVRDGFKKVFIICLMLGVLCSDAI